MIHKDRLNTGLSARSRTFCGKEATTVANEDTKDFLFDIESQTQRTASKASVKYLTTALTIPLPSDPKSKSTSSTTAFRLATYFADSLPRPCAILPTTSSHPTTPSSRVPEKCISPSLSSGGTYLDCRRRRRRRGRRRRSDLEKALLISRDLYMP